MEVTLIDSATSDTSVAVLAYDSSTETLLQAAGDAFGYSNSEVKVCLGGARITPGVPLASTPLESGSCVEVSLDTAAFLSKIEAGEPLRSLPAWVCHDYSCVLTAVTLRGRELRHASEPLQANKTIVKASIQQAGGVAFQFASEGLKANRRFVLSAIKPDGVAFIYAAKTLQGSADLATKALHAAKRSGNQNASACCIAAIPESLLRDREFALSAVKLQGVLLKRLPMELRQDTEVVMAAVKEGNALQYAAGGLRGSKAVVLAAVERSGGALACASAALQADRTVVVTAVRNDHYALISVDAALKADRDFVLQLVRENGNALAFAAPTLQTDQDILRAAVTQTPEALHHIPDIHIREETERWLVTQAHSK